MNTVSLTIDSKKILASEGYSLLWAALDNNIYIPHLCSLKDDEIPDASCRLCLVEIENMNGPVTACTEKVKEGMVVNTRGSEVLKLVKTGFELLLSAHPVDCVGCRANGRCELQEIAFHLKTSLKTERFVKLLRNIPADVSHSKYIFEPDKCVLCGRCVRLCRKKGCRVLGFSGRGFSRKVTTYLNLPLSDSDCYSCGECVRACPTGALVISKEDQT